MQGSGCPGYRCGSWSLQSSPSWMATPLVEEQLAAACPSPSWSFATYSHAPCTVLHLPVAQPAGVTGGTEAAHWASVEHVVVEVGPASPSAPPPPAPPPPHASAPSAMAMAPAPVNEIHVVRLM